MAEIESPARVEPAQETRPEINLWRRLGEQLNGFRQEAVMGLGCLSAAAVFAMTFGKAEKASASPYMAGESPANIGGAVGVESMQAVNVLPRSTIDRPDDLAGRQVHVVYAVPNDGGHLNSDTNGSVNQAINNWNNYVNSRGAPGLRWRIDTYQGQPDITYFMFDKTGAELAQMARQDLAFLDYANAEIKKSGLNNKPLEIYNVLYEATAEMPGCNNSFRRPKVFIGGPAAEANTVLTYLKESGCDNRFTIANVRGLIYNIGFATSSAPHFDGKGNTTDSSQDILWEKAQQIGWSHENSLIDPGHDDYFMTGRQDDLSRVNYITWPLNIIKKGDGNVNFVEGTVASGAAVSTKPDPGNRFPGGNEIALKAEGEFIRWGGDCAQETDDTCDLLMDRPHNVTAFFKETIKKTKEIRVAIKKKLGGGAVTGSGIKCPPDCTTSLQKGKELTLTAKPNRVSKAEWIKGCARKIGNRCIVSYGTTDAPKTATVVFSRK